MIYQRPSNVRDFFAAALTFEQSGGKGQGDGTMSINRSVTCWLPIGFFSRNPIDLLGKCQHPSSAISNTQKADRLPIARAGSFHFAASDELGYHRTHLFLFVFGKLSLCVSKRACVINICGTSTNNVKYDSPLQ